ncbi:xylulokinase [Erythrobacter sp. F6033]|uniref:xylulokinase n=1 Tax=Erythrobacter sp. F6033 TaxID=2926401 RepID=UPI001FF38677|nr:xylulokinase [Erythrobacter sp. F6033]MCK0127622.1 xylulokinase [Erythrobacter sp. F6033]
MSFSIGARELMWLGIDLGTSAVKSVIVDDAGRVLAENSSTLGVQRPKPLWSEQSPADWWAATKASVLGLPKNLRASVRGIGLSGQMHGAVLLDHADNVLRPAILWNDGRSAPYCDGLAPLARKHTGNLAMAGFTAPKLLWVREQEPDVFAATRTVLLPKDYLRLILTGEKVSEMSDASGSLWLDIAQRRWSAEMLTATGLNESQMPTLIEGSEVSGTVRSAIADELGIPVVPVAGGAGDQAAGAIGAGVTEPRQAFLSLGTSGVVFAASDGFQPAPENGVHAFCHALPDRWHSMTVMLSAAACLDWAAKLTGFADVPGALEAAAKSSTPSSKLPLFLPYLTGERTPHNDVFAKGVFFGMTQETGPAELIRSTLEGVAFGLRDGLDAMQSRPEQLSVIGGGSRSEYWAQILADTLGLPLIYRDGASFGPANGAARLARLAATHDKVADVCVQPPELARFEPQQFDEDRLTRFRSLYTTLKSSFGEF